MQAIMLAPTRQHDLAHSDFADQGYALPGISTE